MIHRSGRRSGTALALATALSMTAGVALAQPITVHVLARPGSRMAEDLRRELGASGFLVVGVASTTPDWRVDVRGPGGGQAHRGVVVRADDRLMTVFTRGEVSSAAPVASASAIQTHLEQHVDARDRMARRRACLSVVEYLRLLTSAPPAEQSAGSPLTSGRPGGGPNGRASRSASNPATVHPPTSATSSGISPRAPDPAVTAGAGGWRASTAPVTSPDSGTNSPGPGLRPDGTAASPVAIQLSSESAGELAGEGLGKTSRFPRRWEVGVGSTLGLDAAPGGPSGHLQFLWYLPLDWRLAVCVRALWPVLGGQFRADGNDVRTWTFRGAFSVQYMFDVGPARLRPFVGAALGSRVALTETTPVNAMQSRETFTPGMTLGAEGGVRYALSPLVQLFFEFGVGRGWLIPGVRRATYEEESANANSLHASFGVLFEI